MPSAVEYLNTAWERAIAVGEAPTKLLVTSGLYHAYISELAQNALFIPHDGRLAPLFRGIAIEIGASNVERWDHIWMYGENMRRVPPAMRVPMQYNRANRNPEPADEPVYDVAKDADY